MWGKVWWRVDNSVDSVNSVNSVSLCCECCSPVVRRNYTSLSPLCLDLEKFGFNFTDLISGFGIRSQSGSYAFTGARET